MASTSADAVESPTPNPSPDDDETAPVNPGNEQCRKLFVGGLSYTTTDDKLR